MKAIDFVKSRFPGAHNFAMIDNPRLQTSQVILKGMAFELEIFPNEGATTASKAWTNAKNHILETEKNQLEKLKEINADLLSALEQMTKEMSNMYELLTPAKAKFLENTAKAAIKKAKDYEQKTGGHL